MERIKFQFSSPQWTNPRPLPIFFLLVGRLTFLGTCNTVFFLLAMTLNSSTYGFSYLTSSLVSYILIASCVRAIRLAIFSLQILLRCSSSFCLGRSVSKSSSFMPQRGRGLCGMGTSSSSSAAYGEGMSLNPPGGKNTFAFAADGVSAMIVCYIFVASSLAVPSKMSIHSRISSVILSKVYLNSSTSAVVSKSPLPFCTSLNI